LYSPTYSPGWPGVLPQGQADDMCISPKEGQRSTKMAANFLAPFSIVVLVVLLSQKLSYTPSILLQELMVMV